MLQAKKERVYKFDNIKFLAILLVVIGHCIECYTSYDNPSSFNSIFVFIYSFHMPLLIFISGLFTKRQTKGDKFNIKKFSYLIIVGFLLKFCKMIVQIINIIYAAYKNGEPITLKLFNRGTLDVGLLGSNSIEWYLFVVALCVLIAYLVKDIHPAITIPVSITLGCLIGKLNFISYPSTLYNPNFMYLQRLFVFLPFFLAGYYLTPEKVMDIVSNKLIKVISIVFLIGFFIFCFRFQDIIYPFRSVFSGMNSYARTTVEGCNIQHRLLTYAISTILVVGIISVIPNVKIPMISKMGSNTIGVYFFHNLIINLLGGFGFFTFLETLTFGDVGWKILVYVFAIGLTLLLSLDIFSLPFKKINLLVKKIPDKALYIGNVIVFLIVVLISSYFH